MLQKVKHYLALIRKIEKQNTELLEKLTLLEEHQNSTLHEIERNLSQQNLVLQQTIIAQIQPSDSSAKK